LKIALIHSMLSQAYVSLVGIALMPVYLGYVGAEGLGLIGLFIMVQGLLPLLDLGLSAVLSRDMSRFRAGTVDAGEAWARLRSLFWLFALAGGIFVAFAFGMRGAIAGSWLRPGEFSAAQTEYCLVAIALAAVFRWLAGVSRSALVGLEEHAWLNSSAVVLATIKHVGVLPVLAWISPTATAFFSYHVIGGLLELVVTHRAVSRILPPPRVRPRLRWSTGLREAWSMAGAMTFLSIVWILFNQIDKLILSRVLTLADYGRFSLATSLAGGVLVLIPPMTQVLQPRMTILASQGRNDELSQVYRTACQGAAALFAAAGGSVAVLGPHLLHAWLGDPAVTADVTPTLFWYGLASALVGMLALPFMLQFAHGDLSMHVRGNILLCAFGLPTLAFAAACYGAIGAGIALCASRVLFLLFWIPRVHDRYMPEVASRWLWVDVMPGAVSVAVLLALADCFVPVPDSRVLAGVFAAVLALATLAAGLLAGSQTRKGVQTWWADIR
jgi:O-antigen/teichoic acid export membrane protein